MNQIIDFPIATSGILDLLLVNHNIEVTTRTKTNLTMKQSLLPAALLGHSLSTIEHLQPLKSQLQFLSMTNLQLTNFQKRNFFEILCINFHRLL